MPVETETPRAVCVDLDGTLTAADTLWESLVRLACEHPVALFLLPLWVLHGRAYLKSQLASRVTLNAARLPYRGEVIAYLREQRSAGATIWLVTAADGRIAEAVADHLGLFDGVIASNGRENFKGLRKLEAMKARLGSSEFDYIGDSKADVAIWEHTQRPMVVGRDRGVVEEAKRIGPGARVFEVAGFSVGVLMRALRVHQWPKNLLVLVPLFLSHQWGDLTKARFACHGLLAFCLMASAVYVLNDLLDLETDRGHRSKCRRPFASGELSIASGVGMIPLLLMGSGLAAASAGWPFVGWLVIYGLGTTLYSMKLKRYPLVDALVLAGLYTLRLIAGGAATGLAISQWLAIFSMFFFTSLAFLKRYVDLWPLKGEQEEIGGRGYVRADMAIVREIGISSGMLSIFVLAMYINSEMALRLYRFPLLLWFTCPVLLYWLLRMWLLGNRGQMEEDPILFAVHDRVSWLIGAFIIVFTIIAVL